MSNQDFLIEGIVQDMVEYLVLDYELDMASALNLIYDSQTYAKLADPATGLYIESSAYVFELLKTELLMGELVQGRKDNSRSE